MNFDKYTLPAWGTPAYEAQTDVTDGKVNIEHVSRDTYARNTNQDTAKTKKTECLIFFNVFLTTSDIRLIFVKHEFGCLPIF